MPNKLFAALAVALVVIHLTSMRSAWGADGVVVVEPVPAAPVYVQPAVVQPVAPAPVIVAPNPAPVRRATEGSALLLGLGLVGAGLVAGGAGFAVLYACQYGTACYSEELTVFGWVLAAPGVIPLAVGLIILYAVSRGNGGHAAAPSPRRQAAQWGVTAGPIPGGGGYAGITVTF